MREHILGHIGKESGNGKYAGSCSKTKLKVESFLVKAWSRSDGPASCPEKSSASNVVSAGRLSQCDQPQGCEM